MGTGGEAAVGEEGDAFRNVVCPWRTVWSTEKVLPLWGSVSLHKNPAAMWKKERGRNQPQILPD